MSNIRGIKFADYPALDQEDKHINNEIYRNIKDYGLISRYTLLIQYIQHEDGLLNWRMTWNLSLQGILGTAFGFIINSHTASNAISSKDWMLLPISLILCCIGFLISHWSYKSIEAAILSVGTLRQYIPEEILRQNALPQLTSAGELESLRNGSSLATNLPRTMRLIWILLFLIDAAIVVFKLI